MASTRSSILAHWRGIALGLLGVILLNGVLHAAFIRPRVRTSGDRESVLADERSRLISLKKDIARIERTGSKFSCTKSDSDRAFDEILGRKEKRLAAIHRELRALAATKRVELGRINMTAKDLADANLVEYSITFGFTGNYETLRSFIEEIEASENYLVIEQIGLSGERAQGGELKLQLKLLTYFVAPGKA